MNINCNYVDKQWYDDVNSFQIEDYFVANMRVSKTIKSRFKLFADIQNIFDDPFVYWGFTSATGAKVNTHSVCLKTLRFSTVTAFSKNTRDLLLEGDRYTLKDIDFSTGSTILPKNADEELEKLTMFLKENPEHSIFLSGYTDSSGNAERNQQLSQKRAKSVADYLKKNGIHARRIHFKGYGENDPIAPNDTPKGQKENRRIEVMVKILRV